MCRQRYAKKTSKQTLSPILFCDIRPSRRQGIKNSACRMDIFADPLAVSRATARRDTCNRSQENRQPLAVICATACKEIANRSEKYGHPLSRSPRHGKSRQGGRRGKRRQQRICNRQAANNVFASYFTCLRIHVLMTS